MRAALFMLALLACDKKDAASTAPSASVASAPSASAAPSALASAAAANARDANALPNETRAAKGARTSITKANYKAELDKLDKSIAK